MRYSLIINDELFKKSDDWTSLMDLATSHKLKEKSVIIIDHSNGYLHHQFTKDGMDFGYITIDNKYKC